MFPSMTTEALSRGLTGGPSAGGAVGPATRSAGAKTVRTPSGPSRRSLADLMRGALGTALEFATLGEATFPQAGSDQPAPPAPSREHPHRRALVRPSRPRRDGAIRPRAQVCTAPVPSHPPRPQ
jgi:hypothetical protein